MAEKQIYLSNPSLRLRRLRHLIRLCRLHVTQAACIAFANIFVICSALVAYSAAACLTPLTLLLPLVPLVPLASLLPMRRLRR
jgi:hypothetical protein